MYFNRWSVFIFCIHLLNFLFTSIYARRVLYSIIWVTTFYLDCKIALKFNFEFSKHFIFVLKYFRYNLIISTNSFLYYFNNFLNGYLINFLDYLIVKISKDKITFCLVSPAFLAGDKAYHRCLFSTLFSLGMYIDLFHFQLSSSSQFSALFIYFLYVTYVYTNMYAYTCISAVYII